MHRQSHLRELPPHAHRRVATEYRQQTAWKLSSRPLPTEGEKRTEVTHFEVDSAKRLATVAACADSARSGAAMKQFRYLSRQEGVGSAYIRLMSEGSCSALNRSESGAVSLLAGTCADRNAEVFAEDCGGGAIQRRIAPIRSAARQRQRTTGTSRSDRRSGRSSVRRANGHGKPDIRHDTL